MRETPPSTPAADAQPAAPGCPLCGGPLGRNAAFCSRAHYLAALRSDPERETRIAEVFGEVARPGVTVTASQVSARLAGGDPWARRSVYGQLRALVRRGQLHKVGRGYFPASWLLAAPAAVGGPAHA